MTRIELEKAVLKKTLSDMQIIFEYSKKDILEEIKKTSDQNLLSYLKD